MAWSDLTITRDDIDAYEGQTFSGYNDASILGIASNDDQTLAVSKSELEDDIISKMKDADYGSESDLLDAVYAADNVDKSRNVLARMLTYKFLANWFFQDSSKSDSLSWQKGREYLGKYYKLLNQGIGGIAPKLSKPKTNPRYRMMR